MLRTDIVDRAVPWTRLIVARRALPRDLNTGWSGRAGAAAAWVFALGLAAAPWQWWTVAPAAAALALLIVLNRQLYALFFRRGGVALMIGGGALHLLYFLYSSATFAVVAAAAALRGGQETRPVSGSLAAGPAVRR